jgi:hypothetical protein
MKEKQKKETTKPPIHFTETQALIKEIQMQLGGMLICYWNSQNGSICSNDSLSVYELLKENKTHDHIYLFIKSDGGSGISSLKMVNVLRKYCKKLTALVPLNCASAATMLALGADDIQMGTLSYLTPVDTSLKHDLSPVDKNNDRVSVSMDELSRVVKLWDGHSSAVGENPYKSLYSFVHPLVFGAVDRSSSLSLKLCKELLSYHMKDVEKIESISNMLNGGFPAHEYPILFKQAKEIGLHVSEMDGQVSERLLDLNLLYSEMGQRALTDYDEKSYHNNSINNILECDGKQIYYQVDKDWFYRSEERRYIPMNDESSWRKNELVKGKISNTIYHLW